MSASTIWYMIIIMICSVHAHSQTGVSQNAPSVEFYVGLGESCCGEDPHPVHGISTSDGGYVVVGKTEAGNGKWGGFAAKIGPPEPLGNGVFLDPNESESMRWTVRLEDGGGKSTFLNAASTQSAIFLAGLRASGDGDIDMYLAKHSIEDGTLIWEKRFPSSSGDGAIEAIQLTPEGGMVGAGIINAPSGGLEGFKSFGNPLGGQAHLFYLSAEQVQSDSAPSAPTWSQTYAEHETIKAVHCVPSDEGGLILLVGSEAQDPSLIRTDDAGQPIWSQRYSGRFEATDLALHIVNGQHLGYTFTGHGGDNGTLDGQLTRVDLDGVQAFARSFGDPSGGLGQFEGLGSGDPRLIFDECWGIQGLSDGGVIVGCGTGIEGCDLVSDGALKQQCNTDPRRTWRGYVVRFDAQGQIVWQRVDSFVEAGTGDDVADSASEYIALLPDGGFLSVVDQGFGIGLLGLAAENGQGNTIGMPTDETTEVDTTGEAVDETNDAIDDNDELETDEALEDSPKEEPDNVLLGSEDGCSTSGGQPIPLALILGFSLFALRRSCRSQLIPPTR
jgi:hypothetical protein